MNVRVIEIDNSQVVRSRVDNATACFYPGNKNRIVVVADAKDFAAAEQALRELRDHVDPQPECLCALHGGVFCNGCPVHDAEASRL